ncbi:MAG: Fic family protein [Victivallales bacterium]
MDKAKLRITGYGKLLELYNLDALPHYCVSYVAMKGERRTMVEPFLTTEIYPSRYDPGDSAGAILEFALKYEGVNLEILCLLFQKMDEKEICRHILASPLGIYARKIWFLYEFLTGRKTVIPDLTQGNYEDLLDSSSYYTPAPVRSRRHRINNNLPGDRRFCPVVRKTGPLQKYSSFLFDRQCGDMLEKYPPELLNRTVAYLYTKETRSSFEIENAVPEKRRSARFIALLRRAGKEKLLNKEALVKLQKAIVDERFALDDYRDFQNYVGESIGLEKEIIHYVPPRQDDLPGMMDGMISCAERMLESKMHPVITAAVVSFGFVLLHPFEDGNGRLHRFLIHHILSKTGFTPENLIFPVSATMLKQIGRYDEALESFSKPLMEHVDYHLNSKGEMQVLNQTDVHYRYMDMTFFAERLFEFVRDTIEKELKGELDFIMWYDELRKSLREIVDMPDRRVDLFIKLCIQNKGGISGGKRKIMDKLTDSEISLMEKTVQKRMKEGKVDFSLLRK